jgi:hypothetical protein
MFRRIGEKWYKYKPIKKSIVVFAKWRTPVTPIPVRHNRIAAGPIAFTPWRI